MRTAWKLGFACLLWLVMSQPSLLARDWGTCQMHWTACGYDTEVNDLYEECTTASTADMCMNHPPGCNRSVALQVGQPTTPQSCVIEDTGCDDPEMYLVKSAEWTCVTFIPE